MMKLSTKVALLLMIVTVIPLSLLGYLTFRGSQQALELEIFDRLTSINILKEQELARWIRDEERLIESLAQRPLVRDYAGVLISQIKSESDYLEARTFLLEDHLSSFVGSGIDFIEISILRVSDGQILVSTSEDHERKYRESERFFLEGQKGTYVQQISYSLSHGSAVMHINTPILSKNGDLLAVLAGHVNLASLSQIVKSVQNIRITEETYLVNNYNFFVTESRFEPGSALSKAVYTESVNDCLKGNDGTGIYDDYRGEPVLGAYSWIEERQLCILSEIDQAEAFGPIVTLRNTVLGSGLAIALAAAALGLFAARTITNPLQRVAEGAVAFGEGKLDHRIEMGTTDEIGEVAAAFNEMAADLESYQEDVVQNERLITLGKLSSGIAHEINNPLAVIDSSIYFLKMHVSEEEEQTQLYLERIQDQARKASAIIQSLRDLTKMEEPNKKKLLLLPQITRVIADIKVPSGIKVMEKLPADDIYINVDQDQLKMAFQNIALNAIQAMNDKGVLAIGVEVTYNNWVEISFSDSGQGIAPENLEKIFEPFFSTKTTGIGFGLAIAKMVVEKHGGTLEAHSEQGKGASFIIRLPVAEGADGSASNTQIGGDDGNDT
ncbi:MAG: ATP-binding protein [Desulfobacteria bacterium]